MEELKKHLDTTIVVPSKPFQIANEATGFEESFSLSNDVLKHGVQALPTNGETRNDKFRFC